ncbi:uncharacterized protein ATC70_006295 [Mucor velutinosus]|uniref:Nitrogen regulatory protein areA GATA-like domain-containing protein n=1 Tax=Mucor velutinosus TaxID=708070 RepID=A0AAN7D3P0_9FUNG|nr:hypothetical protein ATC70_006295 [Mucor velutinosus]
MLTKKHALDDDFESSRNVKIESNVDYLSYKFDEMDLAASWRMLTKQKLTIVNGIRLENASWRTWAKQRNNLKTVSPDTLNWLKDSDVTWLYGPLNIVIKNMDEEDRYAKPKVSTTEDTYGLMTSPPPPPSSAAAASQSQPVTNDHRDSESVEASSVPPKQSLLSSPLADTPSSVSPASMSSAQAPKPLKSALKKVTMSDLLKRSASELQINNNLSSNISISEANEQLGAFSPAVIASHRQPKLRFNQYVEQCVALSSNPMNKKKTSRVRMANMDDVMDNDEATEDEDGTTTEEDYDPDDSDGGSVIMMRSSKPHKLRSSIKKIEPALLKTNSRSDHDSVASDDSSSDEDSIMLMPSSSKGHRTSRYHYKQAPIDAETWDAESAESDAFVKHIINASKGKRPITKDPAADRIPVESVAYDTDVVDVMQPKSDYDYEFDDDDWDSHSEHMEDGPSAFSTPEFYTPVAPAPPVGCQIAKAPANNQSVLQTVRPKVERSLSDTKASDEIQQQYDNNHSGSNVSSSNSSNSSLFSSIAHWASSHLWPADDSKR